MNSEKISNYIAIIGIVVIIIVFIITINIKNNSLYKKGMDCFDKKDWVCVIRNFEKLKYKDSEEKLKIAYYENNLVLAKRFLSKNDYKNATKHYKNALTHNSKNKEELKLKIENLKILEKEQSKVEEIKRKQAEEERRKQAIKEKISNTAIYPIPTKFGEGYDNTIRRYGITTIKRINKLAPKAAELVAQNPRCTRVIAVDVADDKSTRNSITFFADCGDINNIANIERFYVTEKQIKENISPKSVKEQSEKIEKGQYLLWCEAEIKARLNYPSTFKSNVLINSVVTRPLGTIVSISFKAKNGFNLETNNIGICNYRGNILTDITINEKI